MSYVGVLPLSGFLLLSCVVIGGSVQASEAPRDVAGEVVSVQGSVFVRPDGRVAGGALKPAKPGDPIHTGDVVNTPSNGNVKILMKDKSIVDLGPSALFKVDSYAMNSGPDRQADVSMVYGTMRAAITQKLEGKGRFRVRTPAATMGVRGTEFIVKSDVRDMAEIRQAILNPGKPVAAAATSGQPGRAGEARRAEESKTEITVLKGQVDVQKEVPKPKEGGRVPSASAPQVVSLTAGTQLVTTESDAAVPARVVKLDTQQLAAISRETVVIDNTFQKAVTIDSVADVSGGGAGEATRAVLANVVAPAVAVPVPVGDTGFAGTFGVTSAFENRPVNNLPVNARVRVLVKWGSGQ